MRTMAKQMRIVVKDPCRDRTHPQSKVLGYCADPRHHHYYSVEVSQKWAVSHDNGCLFSIGLTVGEDDFTREMLERLPAANRTEITHEDWKHAGCQSGCTRRGAAECRW